MAYYNMDGDGEYNEDYSLTPYYNNFDSALTRYPSHNSNYYQNFAYDSIPLFCAYDHPVPSYSRIGYSVSTYSEPKYIEYKPAPHYSAETQFIISYSVSEFSDPDFEEYDPTPYGGGYDLTFTYGKPLPPSDETCYPRSAPSDGVSSGSGVIKFTAPVDPKPQAEGKPTDAEEEQQIDKSSDLHQGEESKEKYGDNGSRREDVYDHEIPSGYGLEAMDLCEGLFGYWPCLSRYRNSWNDCPEIAADCGKYNNQWKETAEYLFGSTNPYGEKRARDDDYGNVIYGYQRNYPQQQPLDYQVDHSWSA